MKFIEGKKDLIITYKGYDIVIDHDFNIKYDIDSKDYPLYTISKLGLYYQGTLENVKDFIDKKIKEKGNEEI